jgi:hypothetical protein
MAASVPREEDDRAPSEFACEELIRGRAEGCAHCFPLAFCEPLDVIQSASSDDSDSRMVHKKDAVDFTVLSKTP